MTDRKYGRNTDGTFAVGNVGKPKGARHKTTQAVLALLEGEAEALTRQAVVQALSGDTTALRLCLERIVPVRRDAPVRFPFTKMQTACDAANAAGDVLAAVSQAELTPIEGAQVMALIDSYRRALETTEIERRLSALESHNEGA